MSGEIAASLYDEARLDEIATTEPIEQPYLRALLNAPDVFSQQWNPTSVVDPPQIKDERIRTRLAKVLIAHCRAIRLDPYNPMMWINRGSHFITMGYGELAVSDAYKAHLLLESFLGVTSSSMAQWELDKDSLPYKVIDAIARNINELDPAVVGKVGPAVSLTKRLQEKTFLVMIRALISIRAYHDAIWVLDKAIVLCGTSVSLQELRSEVDERSRDMRKRLQSQQRSPEYIQRTMELGGVERISYPWIDPEELKRGNKAVKKVKAKFETSSSNATLGLSSVGSTTCDNFGVFARQDIPRGDLIVTDKSAFTVLNVQLIPNCWACSEPLGEIVISMSCCKVMFCTESCKIEAMNTYHGVLCGKDFRWLYKASKDAYELSNEMIPLLLMKVLATAVQQNAKPLKVACVGSLKADYQKQRWAMFKLHVNVVAPVKILQLLGVDVFRDMRFDSWAIQTLILRIENNMNENKEDQVMMGAINPLFSMFNHDCDPSAVWHAYHQGNPLSVVAERDIEKGEEITVSYLSNILMEEKERRERLIAQIGTTCKCARCYRERKAASDAEAAEGMHLMNGFDRGRDNTVNDILRRLRDRYLSL